MISMESQARKCKSVSMYDMDVVWDDLHRVWRVYETPAWEQLFQVKTFDEAVRVVLMYRVALAGIGPEKF